MDRRIFLKMAGCLNLYMLSAPYAWSIKHFNHTDDSIELYKLFQNPPSEARPFVRWWWIGNCVEEKEIIRQLDLLKAAGIGGVEISPFGTWEGCEEVPWLSDKWVAILDTTIQAAKERGMIVDMIGGTGWPYGGPMLQKGEKSKGIITSKKVFHGPGTFEENLHNLMSGPVLCSSPERSRYGSKNAWTQSDIPPNLISIRLIPADSKELDSGLDLTSKLNDDGSISLDIPNGEYNVYTTFWKEGWKKVEAATPGGSGPRLDHLNKQAVDRYLNLISDTISTRMNKPFGEGLRSVFCDSLELGEEYWTNNFLEEFEKRRGYSIEPYLPLVLEDPKVKAGLSYAESIQRITNDYLQTVVELIQDNFLKSLTDWCHAHGIQSRIQAYGRPWVGIDGKMIADIPEAELWFWIGRQSEKGQHEYRSEEWVRKTQNWIWSPFTNKDASSAAHLCGKQIVSCETFTNQDPVFRISLDRMKQGSDLLLMTGVNNLILHGFDYSPKEAPFPGWITNGTFVGEHNTWWPYLHYWTDYAARLSWISQQSTHQANVAILGPQVDPDSKLVDDSYWFPWHNMEDQRGFPLYLFDLWKAIHQNGYGADYVSEEVISNGEYKEGKFRFGKVSYDILIIIGINTLEAKAAQAMEGFARSGGKIIFSGHIPSHSPGYKDKEKNDLIVKDALQNILNFNTTVFKTPLPEEGKLIEWVRTYLPLSGVKPYVEISEPHPDLFQVHHLLDNNEIFMFLNFQRDKSISFDASFHTGSKTPWIWNAGTGERKIFPYGKQKDKLKINLQPLDLLLLVYEPGMEGKKAVELIQKPQSPVEINGPWELTLNPVQGNSFNKTLNTLIDLSESQDPELKTFGGTIYYNNHFNMQDVSYNMLDLGRVYGISEVKLNNKPLGVRWWGKHTYNLEALLLKENNHLEIKVTTVMYNACKELAKDNPVIKSLIHYNDDIPNESAGMTGPVLLFK